MELDCVYRDSLVCLRAGHHEGHDVVRAESATDAKFYILSQPFENYPEREQQELIGVIRESFERCA